MIVCAKNMRPQIVEPKCVHGRVGCAGIEMAGIDHRYFLPGRDFRRGDVAPIFSAIGGQMNQAVIGSAPDSIGSSGEGATV